MDVKVAPAPPGCQAGPRDMTGRELLETLARSVSELCSMVESWRDEQDRLRARIAEFERRLA
jgi:uncharacterized heparinase superfamily protein